MSSCAHPAFMGAMCVACGMKVERASGTNMIIPGCGNITLNDSEASRIQELKIEGLKKSKKLALVLDLDHTLLHAVQVEGPTPTQSAHPGHPGLFHLPIEELVSGTVKHLIMKKRPYLDEFLAQASEFCQMTVYTAGTRRYADAVVKVIDPQDKYFKGRIVSRTDDKTVNNKSLQKIFHHDPSMAVVIDDREDVWRGPQSEQLLLVRPYSFFSSPAILQAIGVGGPIAREANNGPGMQAALPGNLNTPSPVISLHEVPGKMLKMVPQSSMEYSEADDQLPRCLCVLKTLHARFFDPKLAAPNVATILNSVRKDILRGCVITFSGIIPTNETNPATHFLYRLAVSLGATVSLALQPQTTHLLCLNLLTAKVQMVLQQKREAQVFVLHPDWLIYCKWALSRAQEDTFLLTSASPNSSSTSSGNRSESSSTSTTCDGGQASAGSEDAQVRKRKLDCDEASSGPAGKKVHFAVEAGVEDAGAVSAGDVATLAPEETGLPLEPVVLPDMDMAISHGPARHTMQVIDLAAESEDEEGFIREVSNGGRGRDREQQEEEEEGDGDCRVYYDRHMTENYDEDDQVDRRPGDEDYPHYDSFNDDDDDDDGPVPHPPADSDEDSSADLCTFISTHLRRRERSSSPENED